MANKKIDVDGYTRIVNGKPVKVRSYNQNRSLMDALAKVGRPPTAGSSGSYAGGRSLPTTPKIRQAAQAEHHTKLNAAKSVSPASAPAPAKKSKLGGLFGKKKDAKSILEQGKKDIEAKKKQDVPSEEELQKLPREKLSDLFEKAMDEDNLPLREAVMKEQKRRAPDTDPYEGLDQEHGDLYENNSVADLEAAAEKARVNANLADPRTSAGREAFRDVSILEAAVEDAKARDKEEGKKTGASDQNFLDSVDKAQPKDGPVDTKKTPREPQPQNRETTPPNREFPKKPGAPVTLQRSADRGPAAPVAKDTTPGQKIDSKAALAEQPAGTLLTIDDGTGQKVFSDGKGGVYQEDPETKQKYPFRPDQVQELLDEGSLRQSTADEKHRNTANAALQRQSRPSAKRERTKAAPRGDVDTSPAGLKERGKKLGIAVKQAILAGKETQVLHAKKVGDSYVYTPERVKQHKELIQRVLAEAAARGVPRDRKAVIAGGLGGAGKSTTLKDHAGIDTSKYVTVNPDDVKEMMVELGMVDALPGFSPMEMAGLMHEESSDISKMLGKVVQDEGFNVVWDVTLAGKQAKAEQKVQSLLDDGYEIDGVFVDIPPETSVERAMARYERGLSDWADGLGDGGRYVAPHFIMENALPPESPFNSMNRANFEAVKDNMKSWKVYDNSTFGAPPKLLSQGGDLASGAGDTIDNPFQSDVVDPLDSLTQAIARMEQVIQSMLPDSQKTKSTGMDFAA